MLDERYREELIADLCRYVRIPSRSSAAGGEEGALQAVIAEQMWAAGARVRTLEADEIPGFRDHPLCHGPDRQYTGRPMVIGEIGPEDAPALLLLAHSDTVQIFEPEKWTMDPYRGEVRDGRVFGLGASDDKWGLATLLTVMRAFTRAGEPLRKRLVFVSTIDEENGVGNGALMLVLSLAQAEADGNDDAPPPRPEAERHKPQVTSHKPRVQPLRPEAALYLDGADMQICIGNLGGSNLLLHPRSPLEPAVFAQDAERLKALCLERSRSRASLYEGTYFADNMSRHSSAMYRTVEGAQGPFHALNFYTLPGEARADTCRELEQQVAAALTDAPFQQPHEAPGSAQRVSSGSAAQTSSAAPSPSELPMSAGSSRRSPRSAPDQPEFAGSRDLQASAGRLARYRLSYREPWFEPAFVDPATPLVGLMAAAYREVMGGEPCITTISKQDAFVLTNHGHIPTVSFGPARAAGKGAFHHPDECVEIEAVWQSARIVYEAVAAWLAQL